MIEKYPYRFKTEDEFIDDFGENWRHVVHEMCNGSSFWIDSMDVLFGKPYTNIVNKNISLDRDNYQQYVGTMRIEIPGQGNSSVGIKRYMLTKNKPSIPNYKPRKILR